MPAASPGVAAQDAPYTQPHSFDDSVGFHRLDEVGGTAGGEAASAVGAAENVQWPADKALVEKHR